MLYVVLIIIIAWLLAIEIRYQGAKAIIDDTKSLADELVADVRDRVKG